MRTEQGLVGGPAQHGQSKPSGPRSFQITDPPSRGRTRAPAGRQELQPVVQCEGGVPAATGHRDPPG